MFGRLQASLSILNPSRSSSNHIDSEEDEELVPKKQVLDLFYHDMAVSGADVRESINRDITQLSFEESKEWQEANKKWVEAVGSRKGREERESQPVRRRSKRRVKEEEDEDEEDLEVLRTSSVSLECPVLHMLMEDPVRNVSCKHAYSRRGISMLLETERRREELGEEGTVSVKCPVAGCVHHVKESTLEDDAKLAFLVKREKKKQEKEKREAVIRSQRASLAID